MKDEAASTAPGEEEPQEVDEPKVSAGDRIGRYEMQGMLGAGGMSVVYLAHDPELDRNVALKLMRSKSLGPDGARRLQREAQALARLSHPNVVPVYDVGIAGDQAYVAMEYVEGKTLRVWLRDKRTWREVLHAMIDAGRGLAAAHAAGLVHRDFKPDNVLIGKDARVRVLDFGLARLASVLDGAPNSTPSLSPPPSESGSRPSLGAPGSLPSLAPPPSRPSLASPAALITRADQLIGTPAYMAPEQLRRDHTDERADQFSFCVTLYEALFGERPFDLPKGGVGSSVATVTVDVKHAALKAPKPPPRGTKVPRWVHRIVLRGLSFEARDRYPSMDALLAALDADPWRPWRRAGVVAGALAVVGVAAVGVSRAQPAPPPMCKGGGERASTAWGPSQAKAVRDAFAKTGLPYADSAATAVTRSLDAYAASWAKASDEACTATRVRGEQSEEVLDLRQACLTTRLREVSALEARLEHPDEGTVKQASRAAETLSPIDECADVAELRAPSPRPRDKDTAAQVDALEVRLANVEAAFAVGESKDAAAEGDAVLEDAKKLGWMPLVARTDLWRGRAYADLNDDHALPAFRDAFAAALAGREERVLKIASSRLAQEYVYADKQDDFAYWIEVAQAAIDRGGPDPLQQSFVDNVRCVGMYHEGHMFTRLACFDAVDAKTARTRALDEWELVTLGKAASDAGQLERGMDYVRKGYERSLAENGELHPRTIEMRGYVVESLLAAGENDAAVTEGRAAIAQAEQGGVDNEYLVGVIRMYLGAALRRAHKLDEACTELRGARAAKADESGIAGEIAEIDVDAGHPELAIDVLRQALDDTQKELAPEHPNVLASQADLGRALLAHGDFAAARVLLDEARAVMAHAEASPSIVADVELSDARALYAAAPAELPQALVLARHARELYAKITPRNAYWDGAVAEADAWIAKPDKPTPPHAGARPATSRCGPTAR
jgi:predicted Ser/Thr protein kinase